VLTLIAEEIMPSGLALIVYGLVSVLTLIVEEIWPIVSVSRLKADKLYLDCMGLRKAVLGVGYLLLYSKIISIIDNFVRHKN